MLRRGLPPMTVFLKDEYGKEKTDQEIDDAALTNLKKHQTLSGRPVKWLQQPAFVVIRFLPLYSPSNFSSVRRSPTMRPQQDLSRSFCSCCCPPLLSCSFLVPLSLLSHYLSTSLVVFLCFLFPPLVRIPVVCFPPSSLRARTTSAFVSDFVY